MMQDDEIVSVLQQEMEVDEALDQYLSFLLESSDEEEEKKWGGHVRGPNKDRDFAAAYAKLVKDYFSGPQSTYSEADFKRRFRMPRSLFNKIHDRLMGQDPFVQYRDALGKLGIHALVKLVGCLWYLAYGDSFDREDENLQMGETTLNELSRQFCRLMIKEFGSSFLNRTPTLYEQQAISEHNSHRGFKGCLVS
jgi:hypothetical protein